MQNRQVTNFTFKIADSLISYQAKRVLLASLLCIITRSQGVFFGYGRWRDWWIRADKRHALAAKYDKNAVGFIFYKFWKTIPKAYPSCRQSHIHIGRVVKKVSKLKSLKTWRKIPCRNSEKEISRATSSFGVILKILSNELWCNFDPFFVKQTIAIPTFARFCPSFEAASNSFSSIYTLAISQKIAEFCMQLAVVWMPRYQVLYASFAFCQASATSKLCSITNMRACESSK